MSEISSREQYSTCIGLIYVFNLIVGTGALALPAVFSRAGWLLGSLVLLVQAMTSFLTVLFMIETMASANAIMVWRNIQQNLREGLLQNSTTNESNVQATPDVGESEVLTSDSEDTPLVTPTPSGQSRAVQTAHGPEITDEYYAIDNKIEMGEMASMFFNKTGVIFFYICLCVYLYGDLSIYGAAMARSVADVSCTYMPQNFTCNDTISDYEPCWESFKINRLNAYRIFLTIFVMLLGPFAFFNVQKTKYLQMLTLSMRWLAFTTMIIYAATKLIVDGPKGNPKIADSTELPGLLSVCVYSFMCHHSLPALIAPIANKSKLGLSLALDFLLIFVFYLILVLTGSFAFEHLDDLYTLNFGPRNCSKGNSMIITIIQYFLALFPVFTLSTSYPVIAITLRNNLQSLFLHKNNSDQYSLYKLIFPLLAVLPPYVIAMSIQNLTTLVSITGSYAGVGIQYLIPIFLVYTARKQTTSIIGQEVINKFASPFGGKLVFLYFGCYILIWTIAISFHFIEKHLDTDVKEYF